MTANNYPVNVYSSGEVAIQTNSRQLEANGGIVYLTRIELEGMLRLLSANDNEQYDYYGNPYGDYYGNPYGTVAD